MWKNQIIAAAVILFASLLASGCQHQTMLESNWGRAYEAAKYNQILNPDTPASLDPARMDGQAAEAGMDRYREGFKEKPPKDVYNLNIGFGD